MEILAKKNEIYFILIGVVVVGILLSRSGNTDLNLDFATEYFALMPSLFVIILGIYAVGKARRGTQSFTGFMVLGLGFAVLVAELNTQGILIPDLVTANLTMAHIQLLIVVIGGIIGAIVSQ